MTDRVTWYPAAISSADPLVLDTAPGSAVELKWLTGLDAVTLAPISAKGPGQEGETALDVTVPPRIIGAQALVRADSLADQWTARRAIARAFVGIPVRFGEDLALGRLLFERSGQADVEIEAVPRSGITTWMRAPAQGMLDAEWWCPYPHFRDTADTTATFGRIVTLSTSAAADDILDAVGHGFAIGDAVQFLTLTGGAGLSTGVTYYVVSTSFGADTFRVAATPGGSALGFTTDITAGTVAPLELIANSGDVDAPILAKVYGPATEVTLRNVTTGEEFTVTVTLADNTQWLQVDTTPGQQTIRKYTAADTWTNAIAGLDLSDARLWLLRPGNNSARLEVVGGSALTQAVVTYRNRYAGL